MKHFRSLLLAAAAVFAANGAYAQTAPSATAVTQSPFHADAASFWAGQSNGATSCNAVSQTAAQDTITIVPPGGNYVYLTALTVQFSTDATGATAVPTISFTGLNANNNAPPFLSAATTLATTGYHADMVIPFPVGGLKSNTPGTSVTIVPSASMGAHSILCMTAVGYFSAN